MTVPSESAMVLVPADCPGTRDSGRAPCPAALREQPQDSLVQATALVLAALVTRSARRACRQPP
ncbi:hypothetical protein ACWGAN_26090 [Streptomyces sp. NPDC054945]